jgi:L-cysteine/cystine lyase
MLDVIEAKAVGAYSASSFDFQKARLTFEPSAQRYEYGTVSIPLRVGLGAAFGFIQRIGIENVWKRDRMLSNRVMKGLQGIPKIQVLSPENDAMRSAMITFMHEEIPYLDLQRHLDTFNLRTRAVSEGGLAALRISTHFYNSTEEIDRLLEAVRSAKKED